MDQRQRSYLPEVDHRSAEAPLVAIRKLLLAQLCTWRGVAGEDHVLGA